MADPEHTTFHISPRQGWLNDPNGLICHKGWFHVFYQHVEEGCEWNWGLVWGHACSRDLVHWRHLPPALRPTPGGPDCDGCWSGCCAINSDGLPALLYTGVRLRSNPECDLTLPPPDCDLGLNWVESQLAAVPADPEDELLVRWEKLEQPLLPLPPPGLGLTGWRDPFVLQPGAVPGGGHTLLLGSGFKGKGGALLVYRSRDLLQGWEYVGPLCSGQGAGTPGGSVWECPFLLLLPSQAASAQAVAGGSGEEAEGEQQWMLAAVPPHKPSNPVLYFTGNLLEHSGSSHSTQSLEFPMDTAAGPFRLDLGDLLYAPTVCRDAQGRWLLWAWVHERRKPGSYSYAGCLTVPRVVAPGEGGRVRQVPAPELCSLRMGSGWHSTGLVLEPGEPVPLQGPPSLALDIQLTLLRPNNVGGDAGEGMAAAGLLFKCYSADGDGDALLLYDWITNRLELRFDAASLLGGTVEAVDQVLAELTSPEPTTDGVLIDQEEAAVAHVPARAAVGGGLEPAPKDCLELRVLLDHSCLEVFAGNGQVLTTRLYRGALPSHAADSGVSLAAVGGRATVAEVHAWPVGSCWVEGNGSEAGVGA